MQSAAAQKCSTQAFEAPDSLAAMLEQAMFWPFDTHQARDCLATKTRDKKQTECHQASTRVRTRVGLGVLNSMLTLLAHLMRKQISLAESCVPLGGPP